MDDIAGCRGLYSARMTDGSGAGKMVSSRAFCDSLMAEINGREVVAVSKVKQSIELPAVTDIQQFLFKEADLLDRREFEMWASLYTEDGILWVPLRNDADFEDRLHEASLVWDDRELRQIRVARLRHPAIHSQSPPARTVRLVSNVIVDGWRLDTVDVLVRSCLVVVESRPPMHRVWGARCEYWLRVGGGWDFRIARKIVRLTNSDDVLSNVALPW